MNSMVQRVLLVLGLATPVFLFAKFTEAPFWVVAGIVCLVGWFYDDIRRSLDID